MHGTSKKQKDWINASLHKIRWNKQVLTDLSNRGIPDIGEHLYAS
jgi:hypothetical protein